MPKKLRLGDISAQGFKYYGGRIKMSAPLLNGNYKVSANELPAAIVYFNNAPVAFMPYETEFSVTDGKLTAEIVLTRQNTFGTTINGGARQGLIKQGLPERLRLYRRK